LHSLSDRSRLQFQLTVPLIPPTPQQAPADLAQRQQAVGTAYQWAQHHYRHGILVGTAPP